MIYAIKGKIAYKDKSYIIIEIGELSCQVFVADSVLEKTKVNQDIKLFTYLSIKEETIELYGFKKRAELDYFKLLKGISGIGPKSAMNILSLVSLENLEKAILHENVTILTRVSGIGLKTAERIILELKGKIEKTFRQKQGVENDALVIDALVSMGYSLPDARNAIKKIPFDVLETKKRVKQALLILSGRQN